MNIANYYLVGKDTKVLKTEILFNISSAKALKKDLLKLYLNEINENIAKQTANVVAILKKLKKEKLIQLYISSNDLSERTTEAEYLINLYPKLEDTSSNSAFVLIKL